MLASDYAEKHLSRPSVRKGKPTNRVKDIGCDLYETPKRSHRGGGMNLTIVTAKNERLLNRAIQR